MNDTTLTVVGNLTDDPSLTFLSSGAAVANFTVASTPRKFDKDQDRWVDLPALFMRCSVWRQYAENVSESLRRGDRVVVTGRLVQRSYETKEGEKRSALELQVDEIGPVLRYATVQVKRVERGSSDRSNQHRDEDAWSTSSVGGGGNSDAPF